MLNSMTTTPARASAARPLMSAYDLSQGSVDEIELCGNAVCLINKGIPVEEFTGRVPFEQRTEVLGADGHMWQVWGLEFFTMRARRQRTPQERSDWIDRANSRLLDPNFSIDRAAMARRIAIELHCVAAALAPDKPQPRAQRRELKRKLTVLASVQWSLLASSVDLAQLRARLAEVGVVVTQVLH